jgi:hypothetical protein
MLCKHERLRRVRTHLVGICRSASTSWQSLMLTSIHVRTSKQRAEQSEFADVFVTSRRLRYTTATLRSERLLRIAGFSLHFTSLLAAELQRIKPLPTVRPASPW